LPRRRKVPGLLAGGGAGVFGTRIHLTDVGGGYPNTSATAWILSAGVKCRTLQRIRGESLAAPA
jgi:hypothetical protein